MKLTKLSSLVALAIAAGALTGCNDDTNEQVTDPVDPPGETTPPETTPPVEVGKAVLMIDTSDADAPKLGYELPTPLTAGKASIKIKYPSAEKETLYFSLRSAEGADNNSVTQLENFNVVELLKFSSVMETHLLRLH